MRVQQNGIGDDIKTMCGTSITKVVSQVKSLFGFGENSTTGTTDISYDKNSKSYTKTINGKKYSVKPRNGGEVIDIKKDGSFVEIKRNGNTKMYNQYSVGKDGKNKSFATYSGHEKIADTFLGSDGKTVVSKTEYENGFKSHSYKYKYDNNGKYAGGTRSEYDCEGNFYRQYTLNANNKETGGKLFDGTTWTNKYNADGTYESTFKCPNGRVYTETYGADGNPY